MCGITGIHGLEGLNDPEALVRRMNAAIAHRGPDADGVERLGNNVLGHRRLSIIDLSPASNQPFRSADGRYTIVFNGEIYNYRELKSELESLGCIFKTNSDTETIVHAYEKFGPKCVDKLRGMFAFAIWDKKEESLFIARDRAGKKPLFYSMLKNGDFVFGSELKSILAHGQISKEIDPAALDAYLTFGYVPEDFCIFKDVHKLKPGHFMTFKDGQITTSQFWDFKYPRIEEIGNESDYVEELRGKIYDAVKVRLISEVPLGAFLSGGVDSSAVVAMMSQILDKPVKTFSVGFNEDSFDELKYARIAAKHFKTEHHEFVVTPDLVDEIDQLVWHFDEPFADSSAIPTFMVSKLAREFVTVVLSGDGGDELFAGYTRYLIDKKRGGIGNLPKVIRNGLLRPLSEALPHGAKGRNFLYNTSLDALDRYIDSVSQFGKLKKKSLYSARFRQSLAGIESAEAIFRDIAQGVATGDPIDNLLYLDSKTYLPGDILTKVDRMSMAASLEARVPLLDQELIDFVTRRIPARFKLKGRETKYIFKKALEGIVPGEILYREKQGFGVPINEWINDQLRTRIHGTLLEKRTLERGYFDPQYIKILLDEHSKGRRDHSHPLWVLWMLELWQRRFVDG
ncbi:MAG: asparagine synthase (glutamine-hydrolyzing) [Acidobacteria bacterium]|nr:asparagine synthase (glutamine-hydrolyzing) [Acidobacteriota bacterium]